eukprot:1373682-Rhodomonas_salina.4
MAFHERSRDSSLDSRSSVFFVSHGEVAYQLRWTCLKFDGLCDVGQYWSLPSIYAGRPVDSMS